MRTSFLLQSGELSSSLEEDADQMDPQRTTKTTESAPDSQEEALVATTATATATAPEVATEPEMGAAISEPPLSPTTLTVTVLNFCDGATDC